MTVPFIVTRFPTFAAFDRTETAYGPDDLAALIRGTTASRKDHLPWLKLARFGDLRTDKNSLRHDANVLAVTGIEADYDGALDAGVPVAFDAACDRLTAHGIAAIVYTSPSHTEDSPRWRILCPLSCEVAPDQRNRFMGRLNGLFRGVFAGESWTLSQSYYYGAVNRNPSHRVEVIEGEPIDLHDDLDTSWMGKPGATAPEGQAEAVTGEARDDAELIRCIVTGAGYHVELCALAGRYLARGMTGPAAGDTLRGLMLSCPEAARDERWRDRFDSIGDLVSSAVKKYRTETAEARRAVARLIFSRIGAGFTSGQFQAEAEAACLARGLAPKVAHDLAAWLVRERGRRALNG
jgi:hypothetical protein